MDALAQRLGTASHPSDETVRARLVAQGYDRVAQVFKPGARPTARELANMAERCTAEARAFAKEPHSPFEIAASGGNLVQATRALHEASFLLKIASHVETTPDSTHAFAARARSLYAEAGHAEPHVPETSTFSSRDRRLLAVIDGLRERGYTVDIRRTESDAFFRPPLHEERHVAVRYARLEDGRPGFAAEDVLRHELQHLYDWAHGKLGEVAVEADVARHEIRAHYAATRNVQTAVALTRELYPFTSPYMDNLRAEVIAERRAAGRPIDSAAVDRDVFSRALRWKGSTPPQPGPLQGGPSH